MLRLRRALSIAALLLALVVGWLWAGNSGAALGLLWWRTPTFAKAWQVQSVLFASATQLSWFSPWLIVRWQLTRRAGPSRFKHRAYQLICVDEVDAAEFARARREWLGRDD